MANADHRWDFFLAHAGADTERASALYELLAPQAEVFLDARSLQPGDVWDAALSAAQRQSLMTVVLISAKTDRAYYQREEIASAIALAREDPSKHRVVPVYLDGLTAEASSVPYGLRLRHGLTARDADGLVSVASRLLALLGQLTGRSFDRSPEVGTPAEHSQRADVSVEPSLTKETIVSRSETSIVRRGRHPLHGEVLVKDLLSIPDESLDLIWSRHYRTLAGDRVIDIGRHADGSTYELLREIPGHDVSRVVRPDNVIVGALLDDIALQVLRQLKALHGASRPAIHRDVRPTNLILGFEPSSSTNTTPSRGASVRLPTMTCEHGDLTPRAPV